MDFLNFEIRVQIVVFAIWIVWSVFFYWFFDFQVEEGATPPSRWERGVLSVTTSALFGGLYAFILRLLWEDRFPFTSPWWTFLGEWVVNVQFIVLPFGVLAALIIHEKAGHD